MNLRKVVLTFKPVDKILRREGALETGFELARIVPRECFGDTIFLLLLAVAEIQKAPVLERLSYDLEKRFR